MTAQLKVQPELKLLEFLCKRVDSDVSHRVSKLIQTNPNGLVDVTLNPRDYSDATSFSNDYLLVSFLSKWKGLGDDRKKAATALESWRGFEDQCAASNRRLRLLKAKFETNLARGRISPLHRFILNVQEKIQEILGPCQPERHRSGCRWTGGATLDHKKGAPLHKKISDPITVTSRAYPYLYDAFREDIHFASMLRNGHVAEVEGPYSLLPRNFKIAMGSRWLTVPKNAKTYRCISAEPTGNAFLQQGVGRYIRGRLARFGVDLDDQSINQRLARLAQRLGLATLDLKGASDTICQELIYLLLPLSWAVYLDDLRSPSTMFSRGKKGSYTWVQLHKFSSMGNAYTFELESLIFYAIIRVASGPDRTCSVFGDDLIVEQQVSGRVTRLLSVLGFTINKEKSFVSGRFFESCGKHYFDGVDVTPIFQKELMHDLKEQWIRTHNRMVRWFERNGRRGWSEKLGLALHHHGAPPDLASYRIPIHDVSDDGLLTDPATGLLGAYDSNAGYKCRVWVRTPRKFQVGEARQLPHYAYKLRRSTHKNMSSKGHVECLAERPNSFDGDEWERSMWHSGRSYRHNWMLTNPVISSNFEGNSLDEWDHLA